MLYKTCFESPVGELMLASSLDGLVGLWIKGQKYYGLGIAQDMQETPDNPVLAKAKDWLARYFSQMKPAISELPLAPQGSAFRQEVWQMLCAIPYGEVDTYGAISKRMKTCASAQAVGGAVGHNPISIIIPCHRVVGKSGSLTGYAAGIETKKRLLELEGVDMSGLYEPKTGTAL
jgi:methylated-DNA-[protein]-cysteine S-methyltransferase